MKINNTDYGERWIWPDEFDWSPITNSIEPTVKGALVIEPWAMQAGRPITLTGGWLDRAQLDTLIALRNASGAVSLLYRGSTREVYWHGEAPIEARQIFDTSDPGADEIYAVTLRFIEG